MPEHTLLVQETTDSFGLIRTTTHGENTSQWNLQAPHEVPESLQELINSEGKEWIKLREVAPMKLDISDMKSLPTTS